LHACADTLAQASLGGQFVYTHRWRPNNLVMWDNRCTTHRGAEFDDMRWLRDMRRATVSDVANTCEQEGVAVPA
jgi:alpha-ketoglutarate-dependent 2,4-dichlorophenoxyacetate dioxygenase